MPTHSFLREIGNVLLRIFAVVFTIVLLVGLSTAWVEESSLSDGTCNVAVLPIEGIIAPFTGIVDGPIISPADIRRFLAVAEDDLFIQAVLVEINSPGGTPVAAEAIADMLDELSLPTVGLIGDMGASGAYLVAAATDHLIASPMSQVGSLGVTMSYVEESVRNEEEGLTFVELASGEFKEAGNPNKPLTEEERERFERELAVVHDAFVDRIAALREVPRETIASIADGSTYTGKDALEKSLIDELGGRRAARAELASELEIEPVDVVFCEYEPALWWF